MASARPGTLFFLHTDSVCGDRLAVTLGTLETAKHTCPSHLIWDKLFNKGILGAHEVYALTASLGFFMRLCTSSGPLRLSHMMNLNDCTILIRCVPMQGVPRSALIDCYPGWAGSHQFGVLQQRCINLNER